MRPPIILAGNGKPAPRPPLGLADVARDWPADQTARLVRLPAADFRRIGDELAELAERIAIARRRRAANGFAK